MIFRATLVLTILFSINANANRCKTMTSSPAGYENCVTRMTVMAEDAFPSEIVKYFGEEDEVSDIKPIDQEIFSEAQSAVLEDSLDCDKDAKYEVKEAFPRCRRAANFAKLGSSNYYRCKAGDSTYVYIVKDGEADSFSKIGIFREIVVGEAKRGFHHVCEK